MEREGGGLPTKRCLSIASDKRDGQISPAADKLKEFISITNLCRFEAGDERGANICRGDKGGKKKVPACCFASLRASRGDGGMRLFFGDTLTPPLSVFGCALSKTKHCTRPRAFCLSCHAHSFYVPYPLPLLHPSPSATVAPSLPPFLLPLANSQLSLPLSALFVITD